jgi:CRP/FNR family transcriptional regulator, cyclic AMP receptor protein
MTKINIFGSARDPLELEAGEVVFKEGDTGDVMYAVVKGSVELVREGRVIETVDDGGIFGELALVDESTRGATATTATPTRLARVDKKHFTYLVHEHPTFALQVMKIMAERLRNANKH